MSNYLENSMPFAKKPLEDKMVPFSTTLKPEAYDRLKNLSTEKNAPMSFILSEMILRTIPPDPFWKVKLLGKR